MPIDPAGHKKPAGGPGGAANLSKESTKTFAGTACVM